VAPRSAGERAGLVAEQFAFQQFRRDRGGIERDERHACARRLPMQRARDQFLAGAGLAGHQHRQRRLRETSDRAEQCAHRGRITDQRIVIERLRAVGGWRFGPAAERARRQRHRFVEVERLGQELVRAAAEGAGGASDVGIGRHHDHRQLRQRQLEFLQQHQPVVAGHAHVGE
jgi:hypothetical protein